ncbi:MAG: ABC transporter substrate-binding protein [Propionibacteriaceae bacterium]|nr:ABC transporter substrate-binding protein [Propionibacteriaceae bacterium]
MTPSATPFSLSRRQLLQAAGLTGAAVAGLGGLTACGGSGSGGAGGSGQLIHGATGGSVKDTVANPDIARVNALYEPLMRWDDNYELQHGLAESVEPNDTAQEWTVRLRDGITFHNGKTVTAEDVLATIQRVANPDDPKSAGSDLARVIDMAATTTVDDRTVKIVLKRPNAIVDVLLAEYHFGVVPADYDPANPVGTGPFAYQSFTPGQTSTFTKYADYWGEAAKVDSLVIQDFTDENAKVNALLAGQLHTLDYLPTNLVDSVKGAGGGALIAETGAWMPFTMRVDTAPFNDVRVRQAMRLIVDRQQLIDQALSGYGSLGNDLYAPFDEAYAGKDFPQRTQDLEQAKSLLRQAGQENLQVELFTGDDISSVAVSAANLFAEQARGAGVQVRVTKKTPFFGDDYLSYPFGQSFWHTRRYLPQAAQCALKGSPFNETHFDNQAFADLIDAATTETDKAKRATLVKDAQQIEYDEGGNIIWGFRQQVDGYAKGVEGLKPNKYLPLGGYRFERLSVS